MTYFSLGPRRIDADQLLPSGAFEEFLKDFKTSPEQTITTAMGDITIDGDELDDEYDMMDDSAQGQARRQRGQQERGPHHKYKETLQRLANREVDEVLIDLDDLAAV